MYIGRVHKMIWNSLHFEREFIKSMCTVTLFYCIHVMSSGL